jgi:WD40 repeat protein
LTHREAVVGAGFAAPDGVIATLTQDGRLHRWSGNRPEPTVLELPRNVVGGAFDGEGKRILGWRSDHLLGVWSTDDGRELVAPMRHERSDLGIQAAIWSGDGSRILSWGDDRTARVWDARAGKLIALLRHPSTVSGAALSDDQTRAVTWSVDRIVRLWDMQQQAPALALPAHEYGVRGAALTRDNGRILSWDANGSILLWDARNGALLKTIGRGAGFPVRGARFTSDEQRVLAWGEDAVRIWDIGAGSRNVDPILWNAGNVQRAAFNADESIVLTTGDEGARLWSSRSGQPLTRWLGSGGAMQDALLSRDERTLLAWADGSVHTWTVAVDAMPAGQDAVLVQHARTGTRLGRTGDVELMPTTEWQKLRERFALPPADAPIN